MNEPLILELLSAGETHEGALRCPNCGDALYGFVNLRPDMTVVEFAALNVQLGKGPYCLHARLRDMLIHFPNVALDSFPDEYRDDIMCRELL
jgi:hypothetical protein